MRCLLDPVAFWTLFGTYEDERIVLEPWQIHDLRDYSRIRFREKAPQIGYSMLRAMEAVWEGLLFNDATVGFISVDQREASEKILYALKLYEGLPQMFKEFVPRVGTNTEEIKLGDVDRPSRIASYPATAGMRGRRMTVVLDEMDFYKDGGKEAIRAGIGRVMRSPALRLSGGSTCFGQDTELDRMMRGVVDFGDGAEIVHSKGRFPHVVATRDDAREAIRIAQTILDPTDFDEEYNCVRANSSSDPFPASLVRSSTNQETPYPIEDDGRVMPEDPGLEFRIGYDVGHTNNPSFMSIAEARTGVWHERCLVMPSDRPGGKGLGLLPQHEYVVELMSRLPRARLAIDGRGIGAEMAEDIAKRFGPRRVTIIMAGSTGQERDNMILDFKYSVEKAEFTLLADRLGAREMQRTRRIDGKYVQPGSKRGSHYDRFWARAYLVQGIRAGARRHSPYSNRHLTVVGGYEVGGV